LKLTHRKHSGQLRPHEHTSYLPLAFLIFIVGLTLTAFTLTANADHPPPQSGSIGLSGTVSAPPPKTAATITSPINQQHFSATPIKVSGTCPLDTLVEIYKNNIFAGSTACDSKGNYTLEIDLLFGQNVLKAQVYDVISQAGPESNLVTVFYDAFLAQAAPSSFLNFSGTQLLLNTDAAYRGTFPNQSLNVPVTIIGGTAPFAINVGWGDSANQVIARSDNSTFNTAHVYKKPGTYKITLQGSDSKQLVAFLTVAAIVNGKPDALAAVVSSNTPPTSKLLVLWPVYAIAATLVVSFWLGERREKKLLGVGKTPTPPFGVMPGAST
jgi:hypothetical protein